MEMNSHDESQGESSPIDLHSLRFLEITQWSTNSQHQKEFPKSCVTINKTAEDKKWIFKKHAIQTVQKRLMGKFKRRKKEQILLEGREDGARKGAQIEHFLYPI